MTDIPPTWTGLFYRTDGPSQAAMVNTGSFFLGNETPLAHNAPRRVSLLITTTRSALSRVRSSNRTTIPIFQRCGLPLAPSACGLTAPAGIFPGYPGGATGVFFNTNKTLVHGAPINDFRPADRLGLAGR